MLHRIAVWMVLSTSCLAQISTFPYTENFDSWANGVVLQGGWSQFTAPADQAEWTVDNAGTPSAPTGPVGDAPSHGGGRYLYFETSGPVAGAQAHVRTPDFDISSVPGAVIQFWYHLCGVDIAGFNVDVWDPVGMVYVNKLSIPGPTHAAEATPWTRSAPIPFAPITGITHVRIRATRGASFLGDSAFDIFEIYDASAPNMAVISLDTPVSGCALTTTELISVMVSNLSSTAGVSVPISYTISGPVSVGPIADSIAMIAGFSGPQVFNFAVPADFSQPGVYTITVTVAIPGDSNPANDTQIKLVASGAGITIPICEDFEAGANGWALRGAGSFQLGTPAGPVIIGPPPSGGVNSWETNLTGTYGPDENVWVESPDFPFCDMTMPEVMLDVWWNCEFSWDGAVLQSSTDLGATWQNIGAFGDPNNWYNDTTILGLPGGQQVGWTGRNSTGQGSVTWVQARNTAPALAGTVGRVRVAFGSDGTIQDDGFAFDNVVIRQQGLTTDYQTGPMSPVAPVMAIDNDTDVVAVQFTMLATVGSDLVRSIDLVASGTGDDAMGVTRVAIWREHPSTTNGVIDMGSDTLVSSGVFPMDDGTVTMPMNQSLPLGVAQTYLVAYDFGAMASGLAPPAIYICTVANPRVCGTLVVPPTNPTGSVEVFSCPAITTYATGASSPPSPVQAAISETQVVALQVSITANGADEMLVSIDLAASGSGDDSTGITGFTIFQEDPATTDGMIDIATDLVVASGSYPSDDATITVPLGILLMNGIEANFLIAYDFSATAAGATPPATYTVTVSNPDVCGTVLPPLVDPAGTVEVNECRTSLCGDCLIDGFVNILDALRAAQASAGSVTIMPMTEEYSNCNVFGLVEPDPMSTIDILDSLTIAQNSVGLPVALSCC